MSEREHTIVLCYDIADARLRRRVAAMLEARMVRVQKSVFEARMNLTAARALFNRIDMLLDEGDSLRMYVLTAAGLKRSLASGGAPLPEDGGWWLL